MILFYQVIDYQHLKPGGLEIDRFRMAERFDSQVKTM